jgi:cytoskeletal protein CcmA (bactofilin family)
MRASEQRAIKAPNFLDQLATAITGPKERTVTCFNCGAQQQLSTAAKSTFCPACRAYLKLEHIRISGPFGTTLQTAGDFIILPKGDVSSTRVMCGGATIEGILRGYIFCTGTAHIKLKGVLPGSIEADHTIVEKKAEVRFDRPVKCRLFEVRGVAEAEVFAEKVLVPKGGTLTGSVNARAIVIEKGGFFSGDLNIQPAEPEAPANSYLPTVRIDDGDDEPTFPGGDSVRFP